MQKKVIYVGGTMSGYDDWRDNALTEISVEREDWERTSEGCVEFTYDEVYEKVDEQEKYMTFAFKECRNRVDKVMDS